MAEVQFMSDLKHKSIVGFYGSYLKHNTVWLVMEFCVGAVSDLLEVLTEPLREIEISVIVRNVLEGIIFILFYFILFYFILF